MDFVAIVSALLYMQHAGIVCGSPAGFVDAVARGTLAERAVIGAEVLFEQLQARGYIEPERP